MPNIIVLRKHFFGAISMKWPVNDLDVCMSLKVPKVGGEQCVFICDLGSLSVSFVLLC